MFSFSLRHLTSFYVNTRQLNLICIQYIFHLNICEYNNLAQLEYLNFKFLISLFFMSGKLLLV